MLWRFSLVWRRGCATIRRYQRRDEIAALHNQKILTRRALTNQRKRPPEGWIGVAQRRGILEIDSAWSDAS
jgi:hypothetical protein